MARKSKKRVQRRRPARESWFEKIFTFPKLALFFFAFLSVFTVYQVTKPQGSVMGVINPDDFMFVTEAEQQAIIQNAPKDKPPTFHQISVFKDANSNAKHGDYEDCLDKTVTFTISNGNTTKERVRWGCDDPIRIYTKSRTVTVTLKSVSGYNFTGLTYTDKTNTPNKTTFKNGTHSIKVTGFPSGYPATAYFTVIDFGVHKK